MRFPQAIHILKVYNQGQSHRPTDSPKTKRLRLQYNGGEEIKHFCRTSTAEEEDHG